MQVDLAERPASSRKRAISDAKARGEVGMSRVADKADDLNPGWCEKACQALRKFARTRGVMFTVEQARLILAPQLPRPHDERCWGKVTAMAIKRGYIEPVKGLYFPTVSSNGSVRAVYRKGFAA